MLGEHRRERVWGKLVNRDLDLREGCKAKGRAAGAVIRKDQRLDGAVRIACRCQI